MSYCESCEDLYDPLDLLDLEIGMVCEPCYKVIDPEGYEYWIREVANNA